MFIEVDKMIISLKRLKRVFMYIIVFIVCTIFLYTLFLFISGWIEPTNRYREPIGRAVKVFQNEVEYEPKLDNLIERLKLFIWLGE